MGPLRYVRGTMDYRIIGILLACSSAYAELGQLPVQEVPFHRNLEPLSVEQVTNHIESPRGREVVDQVLAIIYHPEGTIVICQSDLRPDLMERVPTLQDAIVKELIILDGKKLQIPFSDSGIDRALARAQESLGTDRAGLIKEFKKQGYSFEEARAELGKTIMIEDVIRARVESKAQVPEKKLKEYHENNPLEFYGLQQAFVPFQGGSKSLTRTLVEREIESGAIKENVAWTDLGTIQGKDFSADKAHIKELPVDSVIIATETDDGLSLLRIVSKKIVSFEERKQEIVAQLGRDRFMKVQGEYFENLMKQANIKYL